MFKQKHVLSEASYEGYAGGGASKPKSGKRTKKPSKAKSEGRLPTNIVMLESGLEVKLNPKIAHAYKGDIPLLETITLERNINHLNEADMADLINQVGAKSVVLHSNSRFQDLSFLPEGVQHLDVSKCDLINIAHYSNAPLTLNSIHFASTTKVLKFSKLKELLAMKIAFDLNVKNLLMENGSQVRLDLQILQGIISSMNSAVVFEGVNTSEDQTAYEELLSLLGRYSIESFKLRDSIRPVGLTKLPTSLRALEISNCPSLEVALEIVQKSCLREIIISDVQSVISINSANILDEIIVNDCNHFGINKTTRAKTISTDGVRELIIHSLDDTVVKRLVNRSAASLPTFQEKDANYNTRLEVSLQALTLEQFEKVLALPLKLDLTMHEIAISGDINISVGIEVQDGEIVKKANSLLLEGLKTKAQLEEVEGIIKYLGGIHKLTISDSPVVESIADVDFGQSELDIFKCKKLIVDEKLSANSQIQKLVIFAAGKVVNLDTSALQDVKVILIENTPTTITPNLCAYELRLSTSNLTIEGKESFSSGIRKIWIDRFRGVIANGDYRAVDAPADVLAKMPDYVEHNLKASALDRGLEAAGRVAEGAKRVNWDKLPGALKSSVIIAYRKVSQSQIGKLLIGKASQNIPLPHYSLKTDDKGTDQVVIDLGQWETFDDQKARLNALEDKSRNAN